MLILSSIITCVFAGPLYANATELIKSQARLPIKNKITVPSCVTTKQVLAIAQASVIHGHAPLKVDLNGQNSNIGTEQGIYCKGRLFTASYNWQSSAGHFASGVQSSMVFDQPGIYKVDLTVKNNYGYTDTTSLSVTVLDNVEIAQTLQQEYEKGRQSCINNPQTCGLLPSHSASELQTKYDEGFRAGQSDGQQICINNPQNCGIVIGVNEQALLERYDMGLAAGIAQGKQQCIDNPSVCSIEPNQAINTTNCTQGEFVICGEHKEHKLALALKHQDTFDLTNEHFSLLIENGDIGFEFAGMSVAYLIQDGFLYQYTGDGTSWSWHPLELLEAQEINEQRMAYEIEFDAVDLHPQQVYRIMGLIENSNWDVIDETQPLQKNAQ